MEEVLAHSAYYNYPIEDAFPLAFVSFRFDLQALLDLTSSQARELLQDFQDRIFGEDWRAIQRSGGKSVTQWIGQYAHVAGLEGLIVPSFARPSGINLVIFPDNRRAESQWEIRNIDRLTGLP
jgi:RES domain-containing protein